MALGGAVLVILVLTFVLGLLIGRQWARQAARSVAAPASESGRKPPAPSRRGGIAAEAMADRVPESTEKLTFYHTLTEPLDGPDVSPRPDASPVAVKIPAVPPAPAPPAAVKAAPPSPVPSPSLPPRRTSTRTSADGGSAGAMSGPPQLNSAPSPWTVQIGAYKSRRQADDSRKRLVAAGLDAYVTTLAAQDGQARYRVRVGTYRTREEAAAAAEHLRAQRSLSTFVTPK